MSLSRWGRGACAFLVAGLVSAAREAAAQSGGGAADVVHRGFVHGRARPPAGFYDFVASHPGAFEFKRGWLERARAVRQTRQALRARAAWSQLNAAVVPGGSVPAATAVSGTLSYPTFMAFFSNSAATDTAILDSATVQSRFWGTAPAPPYSVTTYYQEVSVGRLTVTGSVIVRGFHVSKPDTVYAGGGSCQGICGSSQVPNLIIELLDSARSKINFAPFADPATGHVPAIVILDDQVGGECYQIYAPAIHSIWAHRFSLTGWGYPAYVTGDSVNGHAVTIDDYIIQGGQGGNSGCTAGELAPIGTVTHETGHLFGLPDLYDTSNLTEGIGQWDLMSEGNELVPWRPAHMSAWTLATLGWITEAPVTTSQTITTGPIETSDTTWIVPAGSTPDNEYFLLENRQPLGSDSAIHGPGLLVYHADTVLMAQRLFGNDVNALSPHALWIEEADGQQNLFCSYGQACWNRGDAGDPFPGASANTIFGYGTDPAAASNSGVFAGVVVDSIRQLAPAGAMAFRVTFRGLTVVRASSPGASVRVDGTPTALYQALLDSGATHAIAVDSLQVSADGRTQYLFRSWSDGGARSHTITGSLQGATYVAQVALGYLVRAAHAGFGHVAATPAIDSINGTFVAAGDTVSLTPVPDSGQSFLGWSGDTLAGGRVLRLPLGRPYAVTATFAATKDVINQALTGGGAITPAMLQLLDQLGNGNGQFDVGDLVAWLDRNPGVVSADVVARLLRRIQR